jgi:F0F1-type ATP synthase membrane subunit b/b'
MSENKNPIVDVVRAELEKGTDTTREEFRRELDRRTDDARDEVGARLVDLTEEYFPEEVQQRRRKTAAAAFAAGVGAGVAASRLLGR